MFPQGADVLFNPIGTAPGIWLELPRENGLSCRLAAFPGVPSEMKRMYHEHVVPRLPIGSRILRRACINCFGIGESDCEQMLGELTARGRNPEVGITVHEATITLRINATGTSIDECESLIEVSRREAHSRLGHLIFSEGDQELEHTVLALLAAKGETVATIESGTGGLLAHRFTDVGTSAPIFRGGLVIPPGGSLAEWLRIPADEAAGLDETSAEMALRMATLCREQFRTSFAIAITACPNETDPNAPAPTAHIAVVGEGGARVVPHRLLGDTTLRKSRAAKTGLKLLRLSLMNVDD
jgi:nicotinamide-nucleotide amidase